MAQATGGRRDTQAARVHRQVSETYHGPLTSPYQGARERYHKLFDTDFTGLPITMFVVFQPDTGPNRSAPVLGAGGQPGISPREGPRRPLIRFGFVAVRLTGFRRARGAVRPAAPRRASAPIRRAGLRRGAASVRPAGPRRASGPVQRAGARRASGPVRRAGPGRASRPVQRAGA